MNNFFRNHKNIWTREFSFSVALAVVMFLASEAINYVATTFATERVSLPVTDIILSNLRVFDVDGIIISVSIFLIAFTIWQLIRRPERLPFVLKSLALFIFVRSVSITLTHVGPFSPRLLIDPTRLLTVIGLGSAADLFFSGHTGMPFLLALTFWSQKTTRLFYLVASVTLAVCVLLSHLHYSIDVFAAYFITYSIFHLARIFFAKDWQRFNTTVLNGSVMKA